jgi:hypothetical protein
MTQKEKVALRKLKLFKKTHFNNLVAELFTVKKRQDGEIFYEDIYFDGIKYACFVYDGIQVKFMKLKGANSCVVESKESPEEINSLPQS